MRIKKLTKRWLEQHNEHNACLDQIDTWSELFPSGMELTDENVWKCRKAGLDVIWVACHLMTRRQRKEFIVFTLRQRQPHLVVLLEKAALHFHAEAIRALDWTDLAVVQKILDAASRAAAPEDTKRTVHIPGWTDPATEQKTPDAESRAVAPRVARVAWDAVWEAAWDAARDAERNADGRAVWIAAQNVARTVARAGAWDAVCRKQVEWCIEHMLRA